MADYEERDMDDLTEEPSQSRLDDLKAKGQVAQSRELTGTLVLIAVMITIYFLSSKFITDFSELLKEVFTKDIAKPLDVQNYKDFGDIGTRCLKFAAMAFLPIGLAAAVLGILTSVAQVGFNFTTEPLNPDFNRLNPVSGFMKLFSLKSVTELLKTIAKFAVVGGAVYAAVKSELLVLPGVVSYGAQQVLAYIGQTTTRVFGTVAVLLLATSCVDYFIQWRRFRKQAMMTKQEAKQEAKERDGDPQVKARIRTIQRESARKRMMKAIPKADVVVTNPTHIAVAIMYDPENGFAPRVVAKGADFLAQKIKSVAREHGIPTVENKPLARTLYKHVKVGQMIPRSLYQAVAEILAYVYKLKGKRLGPSKDTTLS